jgi:hypothetical protein
MTYTNGVEQITLIEKRKVARVTVTFEYVFKRTGKPNLVMNEVEWKNKLKNNEYYLVV